MGSNSFRLEIGQLQQAATGASTTSRRPCAWAPGSTPTACSPRRRRSAAWPACGASPPGWPASRPGQVRAVATQTLREARNRNAFLLRAQEALGFPDRGHLRARGGAPDLRRRGPPAAGRRAAAGGRHRRPLDRADPGPGPHADGGRVLPRRLRQPVDALLRGAASPPTASAPPRWPPARSSRKACSPSRPAAGAGAGLVGHGRRGVAGAAGLGVTDGRITPAGCAGASNAAWRPATSTARAARPEARAARRAARRAGHPVHAGGQLRHPRPVAGQGRAAPGRDHRPARAPAGAAARAPGDMRDASVAELQRRFASTRQQAARVAQVALALFDSAMPDADPRSRRELAWACALHEVGLMVSHHDHHRHSAYLLAMSTRRASRRASSAASASWCWASAAACARSRRTGQRDLRLAGAVPAAGGHQVPCARRGDAEALTLRARGREAPC
jgi:exopolyphosphatase / guanosine-5'-triphosphate,3'-diphosphate pyrophosphatase